MIKAKLSQLLDSTEALTALSSKAIPVSVSFKLAKIIKLVDAEAKAFQDARMKRAQELGSLSEDKTQYLLSEENKAQFVEEMTKLLVSEVSLSYDQFKVEDFGKIELEPKHLAVLDWLVSE